ncbi:carboxypeptidase-like regulatory domain-containing protein [Olleya sp. HaHaR_3_96]|uniref:carboxypeptidase-like regulatory domain-containing protein n=1 Tax=Olleya sp. HaHaR_3_96 TaxID=2745560 RepID=UPI001C4FC35E|nr:carboxypeptidase-like regulatory domain-containing protein [Olleya sp. HaHaR_3_96]QXP60970.1 carboxypeptidase-like regulatory domain-containing protein [Olleya sp. HaHaR_3_96]
MKKIIFLFLVLTFSSVQAQVIKGVVTSIETSNSLESVEVYFNNTTIGVLTNIKGEFEIPYYKDLKTPLIISYLGYQKFYLQSYKPGIVYDIKLEEEVSALDEVVILSNDKWARKTKLKYFKDQFLGKTLNGKSCVILNEEDIRLRFIESSMELVASASKPIIIENRRLNYSIEYDLQDFTINFEKEAVNRNVLSTAVLTRDDILNNNKEQLNSGYSVKSVFFNGIVLFKDIKKSDSKVFKRRLRAYKGSSLHFLRSLSEGLLEKENFKIIRNEMLVEVEDAVTINSLENQGLKEVTLSDSFYIKYNDKELSFIQPLLKSFKIDVMGNYTPVNSIIFGGRMSDERLGDTLPLDYILN